MSLHGITVVTGGAAVAGCTGGAGGAGRLRWPDERKLGSRCGR